MEALILLGQWSHRKRRKREMLIFVGKYLALSYYIFVNKIFHVCPVYFSFLFCASYQINYIFMPILLQQQIKKIQFLTFDMEKMYKTTRFFGEELLAPRPTPKLEENILSAVRDCLFNIFAATLQNGGRFFVLTEDAPCRGDRDPFITGTCAYTYRKGGGVLINQKTVIYKCDI